MPKAARNDKRGDPDDGVAGEARASGRLEEAKRKDRRTRRDGTMTDEMNRCHPSNHEVPTDEAAMPKSFARPKTGETMVDPVVAPDGVSSERAALEQRLENSGGFLPKTRVVADKTSLRSNTILKGHVGEYLETKYSGSKLSSRKAAVEMGARSAASATHDRNDEREATSVPRAEKPRSAKRLYGRGTTSSAQHRRENDTEGYVTRPISTEAGEVWRRAIRSNGRHTTAHALSTPVSIGMKNGAQWPAASLPCKEPKASRTPEVESLQQCSYAVNSAPSTGEGDFEANPRMKKKAGASNVKEGTATKRIQVKEAPEVLPPQGPPRYCFGGAVIISSSQSAQKSRERIRSTPRFASGAGANDPPSSSQEDGGDEAVPAASEQAEHPYHAGSIQTTSGQGANPAPRFLPESSGRTQIREANEEPTPMVTAELVSPDQDEGWNNQAELIVFAEPLKKNRWIRPALVASVFTIVGVTLGLTLSSALKPIPTNESSTPGHFPNFNVTRPMHPPLNTTAFEEIKKYVCLTLPSSCPSLSNETSPQYKALVWLASDPKVSLYSGTKQMQRYALASLYRSTSGWEMIRGSWMDHSADECDWYKVNCSRSMVSEIMLGKLLSGGTLPRELALLNWSLKYLDLGYNQFSGTIPLEFGLLGNLQHLFLPDNHLRGSIPTELGHLTHLESLSLRFNELTGSMPEEVCLLTPFYTWDGNLEDLWADCLSTIECDCCTQCCNATECCSDRDCIGKRMILVGKPPP